MLLKSTKVKKEKTEPRIGCLIAYNLIRGSHLVKHGMNYWLTNLVDLLIDSGAFAAFRLGKPIDLDEYMGFLANHKDNLFGYFALDVIGDRKRTMDNLREMRKQGFRPWPVFTVGNTRKEMNEMFDQTEVLGIGGIQYSIWPFDPQSRLSYLKMITEWSEGRKMHFLGIAKEGILRAFKPYSCDASTWLNSAKFGRLSIYLGNGRWQHLFFDDIKTKGADKNISREVELEISRAGFTLADLKNPAVWNNKYETVSTEKSVLVHATSRSWIKYVIEFEKRFGTKMFLVIGGDALADGKYPIPTQIRRLLGYTDPEDYGNRVKELQKTMPKASRMPSVREAGKEARTRIEKKKLKRRRIL